jgi:3',5'-cyclic AMP phosphodiesterase CpdA
LHVFATVECVRSKTLAHLSDLHLGRSRETDEAAERLRDSLDDIDHVVVTGDITNRGRRDELARFHSIFGGLERQGRLTVVPGNHDRLGDDVGKRLMRGGRVEVAESDDLYLVRVDSTGPHNRFLLAGHGDICDQVLELIDLALEGAQSGQLRIVMLHHHLLPLPTETLPEWLATQLGWPFALELRRGKEMLERLRGRCDLVLHGHRHVPREWSFFEESPLKILNAGCSTSLQKFRVFSHSRGRLVAEPMWRSAYDVDQRSSVSGSGGGVGAVRDSVGLVAAPPS